MIKELEELKLYNRQEEARQVDLISQVIHLKKETAQVQGFKHEAEQVLKSAHQTNESERKDIEHVQKVIRNEQQVNFKNNESLNDLRSKGHCKDKENESLQHNVNSLNKEIQRNKQSINEMENQQQDLQLQVQQINSQNCSLENEIAGIKTDLKQLDNEICYFEEQNRKHAQAQSQLQKALEYELCRSKELAVSEADAKVRLRARENQCQ